MITLIFALLFIVNITVATWRCSLLAIPALHSFGAAILELHLSQNVICIEEVE
jgi:hypothetical protein